MKFSLATLVNYLWRARPRCGATPKGTCLPAQDEASDCSALLRHLRWSTDAVRRFL